MLAQACRYALTLGYDPGRADNNLYYSAAPKVVVRNATGHPLPGKHCTITEAGDGASADIRRVQLSYSCGPSDANGVMRIEDLRVSGGAAPPLALGELRPPYLSSTLAP